MEQGLGLIEQIRTEPNEVVQIELLSKAIQIIEDLGINESSKLIFEEIFRIFEFGDANDSPMLKARALAYVNRAILSFFPQMSPEREAWFGIMCNFLVRNTSNVRLKVKTISFFNRILTQILFYTVQTASSRNKEAFGDFIQNKFWNMKGAILSYFFDKSIHVDIRVSSLKFAELCLLCFTQQEGVGDFNLDSFSNMTACEIIPKTLLQKDMEELLGSLLGRLNDNLEGTTILLSLLDTLTEVATRRARLCGQILIRVYNFAHTTGLAGIAPEMHPSLWYGLRRSLDAIAEYAKSNGLVNDGDLKSIKDLATTIAAREHSAKRPSGLIIPEPPIRRTSPPPLPPPPQIPQIPQAIPLQYQYPPAPFPTPPPLPPPPPPPPPIMECKRLDELFPKIGEVRKDDVIKVALEAMLGADLGRGRPVPQSKICEGVCNGLREYIAEMKRYRKGAAEMTDEQKRAQSISAENRLIRSHKMAQTASALGLRQEFLTRTADIENIDTDPITVHLMEKMRDYGVPDQEKYDIAVSLLYKIAIHINTDTKNNDNNNIINENKKEENENNNEENKNENENEKENEKEIEKEENEKIVMEIVKSEDVEEVKESVDDAMNQVYEKTFMALVHSVNNPIPIIKSAPWIPDAYIMDLNDTALHTGDIRSLEVQEAIFMDKKAHKDVCFNNLLSYTASPNDVLRHQAITIVRDHLHILGDPITSTIEDYAVSSILSPGDAPPATRAELFYKLCSQSRKLAESLLQVYVKADEGTKAYIAQNIGPLAQMIRSQRGGIQALDSLLREPLEGAYDVTIALLRTLIETGSGEEVDRLHEIAAAINGIPTDPPPLYYLASRLSVEESRELVLYMAQHSAVVDYTWLFGEMRSNMLLYCLMLPDLGVPLDKTRNMVACCFNSKLMSSEEKTRLFTELGKMIALPVLTVFVIFLILSRDVNESNWINEYILPQIDERNPWNNVVMSTDLANCCVVYIKILLNI